MSYRDQLWKQINLYVETCGGDPSRHVYGNKGRQDAVRKIEALTIDRYNRVAEGLKSLNQKVTELDEAMADPTRVAEDTETIGGFVSGLDLTETAEEILDRAILMIMAIKEE